MYPIEFESWWYDLAGTSDLDIADYLDSYGLLPAAPTDAKAVADATAAKAVAVTSGNTKLANTLDFFLKYGDKALEILSKNGVIKNANALTNSGYSAETLAALSGKTTSAIDSTSNAPSTSSRVFNLDFTDPLTLIITFVIVMLLAYFLFFKTSRKNAKN